MKLLSTFTFLFKSFLLTVFMCTTFAQPIQANRDVASELQSIQKQKQLIKASQQALNLELGQVGENLKRLDIQLLKARKAYRSVRKKIKHVDKNLQQLAKEKKTIKQHMQKLHQQMIKEAAIAYQHSGTKSVWVDVLSDTSITEMPHRQFLLKTVMLSQEEDRQVWRQGMEKLVVVEQEEQRVKDKLLALQKERKNTERELVSKIKDKKTASKQLHSSLKKQKKQEQYLLKQEQVLQRLLQGLGDTLLASDKGTHKPTSIRKKKGKLSWPLKGRVLVGFGKKTAAGTTLAGVHLSPEKRSEKGKLVRALGQGQVRYADWFGGYGLMMIVDYGHGIMAVYAHNDALHKQLGDWVEQGETLAEAGSTGWIDDVRLYFEIRDQGKAVNPARWCKQ